MLKKSLIPFTLFVLLALTACTSNLDKANGKWACDGKATIALMGDTAKKALGFAESLSEAAFGKLTLVIDSQSKKMTGSLGFDVLSSSSPFTVVSDKGSELVIKTDKDTLRMTFKEDGAMVLTSDTLGDQKLVFTKAK